MKSEDQNPMFIMIVEQLRDIRDEIKNVRSEIKDVRTEIKDIRSEIKDIQTKIDDNYQKLNAKIDDNYQKLDAKIDDNYQHHEFSIKQLNNQRITWSTTLIAIVFIGSIIANIILARLFPFLYKVAEVESVVPVA